MTPSENLVTQSETFETHTTVTIRHQLAPHFETAVFLVFEELIIKTLHFGEQDNDALVFSTDRNMILMQFCLQGACSFATIDDHDLVKFKEGAYNILFVPKGDFKFSPSATETTLLNVFIEQTFFFDHIPANHFAISSRKANAFSPIFSKNLNIQPQLKSILNDIRHCEFDVQLKKMYLKAKVMELLTLQLVQYDETKMMVLKPTQVEKMRRVREIIDQDLSESPSLALLARVAGTNEQYLKKHFKLLYGHTVFGYMLTSKMQKAKEMLLSGQHNIAEIAEAVGYKHATHFTNAFKKFFGYLPKLLKSKFLLGGHFLMNMEFELLEMLIAI